MKPRHARPSSTRRDGRRGATEAYVPALEVELHSHLYQPVAVSAIDLAEVVVGEVHGRAVQVLAIEEVVGLEAELEVPSPGLREAEVLQQGRIDVPPART